MSVFKLKCDGSVETEKQRCGQLSVIKHNFLNINDEWLDLVPPVPDGALGDEISPPVSIVWQLCLHHAKLGSFCVGLP